MRENRPSGLMRGGKQTVIGLRASQSVVSRLLYSLRRACPESVEGISRGRMNAILISSVFGTDGIAGNAVSFENGEL